MVDIMESIYTMFGSRITKGKRLKIRSVSAFKPNTPLLQHSNIFHVGITQFTKDVPITNNLDSHSDIRYGYL
jgi:hypothetical protein